MKNQKNPRRGYLRGGVLKSICWVALTAVVLGLVSCDCSKKTCRILRLVLGSFVTRAQTCCIYLDDIQISNCFVDIERDMEAITNTLVTLQIACEENDQERIDELLDRLRDIVFNEIILDATGKPKNTLPAMFEDEPANVNLVWNYGITKTMNVNMVSDGTFTMLAEAAGNAAIESGSEIVLIAVADPALEIESWRIQSGSTMSAQIGLDQYDVTISGSIQYSTNEITTPSGLGHLLTSAKILTSWEGGSIRFVLDKTCQWNRVTDNKIEFAVIPISTDPSMSIELALYPKLWIELPLVSAEDTVKTTMTDGWVSGASLFPAGDAAITPDCDGGFGSDGTIDFEWACQDADGDGRSNYSEYLDCRLQEQTAAMCGSN